ncbi:hypothetical protein INT45_006049 [Circinella minor]|uniref:Ndc10 domain-containing protein n=1 Tax=Circinella minor TaxID=1195481 RepID=A0A8H7S0U7_9FUNG|nr:hypothetical protein INT45_006049 [Circinella minor]
MSSSNQAINSQSNTRQSKEEYDQYVKQLIKDHIPHFENLSEKKKGNKKASFGREDNFSEMIDDDGQISERLMEEDEDTMIKEKAYKDIQEGRSYQTAKSYCAKQVEYLIFCDKRYHRRPVSTRFQATGDKLVTFLYKKVINRQIRIPGKQHIDDPEITNEEMLNPDTITAIKKNYPTVPAINSNPTPRTKVISLPLALVRKREANNDRENNVDRATSYIVNGYSTNKEVAAIAKSLYNSPAQQYKHSFRNSISFLMVHFLLLRGDNVRKLEFADLQFPELPKVGAVDGTYPAMLFLFTSTKTNKTNKKETLACIRNKMVENVRLWQ